MSKITANNNEVEKTIEEETQVIMQVMRDRGEPMEASEIREMLDEDRIDSNRQVHYRFDSKLIPLGFGEKAGTREKPGSIADATLYAITDVGREFLNEHESDVRRAVDAQKAMDSLARVRETLDSVIDRNQEMEESVDSMEERLDTSFQKWSSNVYDYRQQVKDYKERLKEKVGKEDFRKLELALLKLRGRVDNHENRLDALDSGEESLSGRFADWTLYFRETFIPMLERAKERSEDNEKKIEDLEAKSAELEKRIEKLENKGWLK